MFEATRKALECYGAEINPSAVEMARTVYFAALHPIKRKEVFQKALAIAEKYAQTYSWDLFSYINQEHNLSYKSDDSIETDFHSMLQEVENEPLIYNLLINAIIRYMTYHSPRSTLDFIRALQETY